MLSYILLKTFVTNITFPWLFTRVCKKGFVKSHFCLKLLSPTLRLVWTLVLCIHESFVKVQFPCKTFSTNTEIDINALLNVVLN